MDPTSALWPELPFPDWRATCETLHLWTQIVGKIRLTQSPWVNHSWHVTLYVSPRGLTTSAIPHGGLTFQIEFDFIAHSLVIEVSDGSSRVIPLRARSVADFHAAVMNALTELAIPVRISGCPCEIPNAIPFAQDQLHASYEPEYAHRFWRVLVQADRVFKQFRAGFMGKASPVHFFWGSFDLAVTRFSGRPAPLLTESATPGLSLAVARESYSHEVSSAGFWQGSGPINYPAYYSYAYPEPDGFAAAKIRPAAAFYSNDYGQFILPYDTVRQAADPEAVLLEFLQSTYDAAANLGKWDRAALDCKLGEKGKVRRT